ncbi:hypothetical protein KQX54_006206 [Cotesia glomerata]|uniref:Uncharacterized protein n=1 Tax=Cotesia glomerata TaxID=32391 RepID=A0AAV7IK24_COTGL|nr:hypothetical protein KQX54_006206 [Cotesia glomerata]
MVTGSLMFAETSVGPKISGKNHSNDCSVDPSDESRALDHNYGIADYRIPCFTERGVLSNNSDVSQNTNTDIHAPQLGNNPQASLMHCYIMHCASFPTGAHSPTFPFPLHSINLLHPTFAHTRTYLRPFTPSAAMNVLEFTS